MCDTLAALHSATDDGAVIFGKNSDREYNEAQHLTLVPAARHPRGSRVGLTYTDIDQVPATNAVLLSRPHWIWGAEIGANAHGLVIGNEALFSKLAASTEGGVIGMDYLRLALERAQDVQEAIHVMTTLLRQHGQGGNCGFRRTLGYHNSFILADPKGAKVLETVEREWVVQPIAEYEAISNAMTIGTTFEASSSSLRTRAREAKIDVEGVPFAFDAVFGDANMVSSGHHRRGRALSLLAERRGRLQAADFFRILRDHLEGAPLPGRATRPRICAHTPENPLGQTTASWVATLLPHKFVHWVTATFAPCTSLFKPVLPEAGLPSHGPRPGADRDPDSLWWRHEQLRKSLDASDGDLRESFSAERDNLEARFLDEMRNCPSITDDDSRREAGRIVESCWDRGLEFESRWLARFVL